MALTKDDTVSSTTPNEVDSSSRSGSKHTETKQSPSSMLPESKTSPRGSELPVVNNVFYNEETLKYMKIIEMYKRLGIGKDIELPRLVIAGAQSCGKSSLLENLTGLPVPITTGIGTRFPIEITLIEDPKRFQTKPSIILDPKARDLSVMDKDKVQQFNLGHVYHESMTQTEFQTLLRQASDILGVPPPVFAGDSASGLNTVETSSQISSHVLQIEMRGKDFKSLSFVDTPGLYHSGNSEQDDTSVDDIENLVTSLIAEKRTLIVAVMDATQSTVGQRIFKFSDDVDTTGERTIGVMTKCDLAVTSETDDFDAILRRARNQDRVLKHGWYVVKNRSSTETKANVSLNAAREKESRLFTGEAWRPSSSGLRHDRMGIHSLRTGLSNVFCAHIRAEFPAFNQQTRTILSQKRKELASLGPARSTFKEQRDYLKLIVDAYQEPKTQCLIEDFRPGRDTDEAAVALQRRLAVNKNTNLRDSLKQDGAVWIFQPATADRDDWSDKAASASFVDGATTNIYTWINHRYQETKSCAMPGLVPYELVERLFEEQTAKWKSITSSFAESVKSVLISAAAYCLRIACPNDLIYAALEHLVVTEIDTQMFSFQKSCYSLIDKERKGMQVIACEEQFVNDIRKARTLRLISAIAKLENNSFLGTTNPFSFLQTPKTVPGASSIFANAKSTPGAGFGQSATAVPYTSGATTEIVPKTTGLFANITTPKTEVMSTTTFKTLAEFAKDNQGKLAEVLTNERQIVYEIHDILKAYYNISVQNYTDMVCKNELNDNFVKDTMNVFSKTFIDRLSESEISSIAAESPADRKKRRELKEDIEKLEMAIRESEKILKQAVADYE